MIMWVFGGALFDVLLSVIERRGRVRVAWRWGWQGRSKDDVTVAVSLCPELVMTAPCSSPQASAPLG